MEKALLSIEEFCTAIGVRESTGKKLIREGQVLSVKIGDRRLIPVESVRAYIDRLVAHAASVRDLQPVA